MRYTNPRLLYFTLLGGFGHHWPKNPFCIREVAILLILGCGYGYCCPWTRHCKNVYMLLVVGAVFLVLALLALLFICGCLYAPPT